MNDNKDLLLSVDNLCVEFATHSASVQAVRGVSFDLYKGETVAIVGESGSGKSVTVKTIMGLLADNGTITDGKIEYKGLDKSVDLVKYTDKQYENIRGSEMAMIFQDPMTALNPTMKIGKQIMEGVIAHQGLSKSEARKKAVELIKLVGIDMPEKRMKQYPFQFSGGMRQRMVIAIALSCNPKILIADEPTTALDVTIQAQILELINDLQAELGVGVIFITHDLGVVANVADRVCVMYAGKFVEIGTDREIFYNPIHPYTWGLLSSMPTLDGSDLELYNIPGTPPDMTKPPVGDAFALRSEFALQIDMEEYPPYFDVSPTHKAATWLRHEDAPKVEPPEFIKRIYDKKGEAHGE